MSDKYGGDAGGSRRADGGEPVREPLEEPEEMEELPTTTIYRNVSSAAKSAAEPVVGPVAERVSRGERREPADGVSRRGVLKAAGAAGFGLAGLYGGWVTDVDGDGVSNGEELRRGTGVLDQDSDGDGVTDGGRLAGEHSEVEREAYQLATEQYPEHAEVVAALETFVTDDALDQRFVDRQLELWLDLPRGWKERILAADGPGSGGASGLYLNDWNRNGQPHLRPDGSRGPDYGHPVDPNPDGDAFMPGFYNRSATTHDVVSGAYRGFRPEDGDKVGKRGDRDGNGSIAAYLDGGVAPADLTGERVTVTWTDTSGDPAYVDDAFDIMEEFFQEEPPGDTSIAFYGINGVTREGVQAPPPVVSGGNEAIEYYERNVPDVLKGPVNYMLHAEDLNGPATALATSPSPGGQSMVAGNGSPYALAYMTLHELYWHGLTGRAHPGVRPADTIASYPPRPSSPEELDFLEGEWQQIMDAMDVENREYHAPLAGDHGR